MNFSTIFSASALIVGTLASSAQLNEHGLSDLAARDIDPTTVDPTRLSVLSVLKTAMPTGENVPLPTGDFEPDWYKNLQEDVKSLLPSLYPGDNSTSSADATASATAPANTTVGVNCTSQVTITETVHLVPTGTVVFSTPSNGTNGTLATATPSQTSVYSAGTKNAFGMEAMAALAWVTLGAGFFLFA